MSTKLEQRLKKIKERCDAATEGPWEDHNWDVMEKPHVVAPKLWDGKTHCDGSFDVPCTRGNASFIAQARTDVPMLLDLVNDMYKLLMIDVHLTIYEVRERLEKIMEKYDG